MAPPCGDCITGTKIRVGTPERGAGLGYSPADKSGAGMGVPLKVKLFVDGLMAGPEKSVWGARNAFA